MVHLGLWESGNVTSLIDYTQLKILLLKKKEEEEWILGNKKRSVLQTDIPFYEWEMDIGLLHVYFCPLFSIKCPPLPYISSIPEFLCCLLNFCDL